MRQWPKHPSIYELNTWVWLNQLGKDANHPITLANVPDTELQRLSDLGFDGLWLMGVWQRSPAARRIAQDSAASRPASRHQPADWTLDDIVGSAYAVHSYRVDPVLGGNRGLAGFRKRLHRCGLRLILDFVPNHLAIDHPWTRRYPERFVQGTAADLRCVPQSFFRCGSRSRAVVLANGRDPNFDPWIDTVQLDYRRSVTRQAMTDQLARIAASCDGVRCDMAMLVNQDIFLKTWSGSFERPENEFWLDAIPRVRARYPAFLFLAEVYWGLEQEEKLLRFGFDYVYDKRLYDYLLSCDTGALWEHLREVDTVYQSGLARFIENHDERRARTAFGLERSRAAATLALALPGLRLLHEGQMEGFQTWLPVQVRRRQVEPCEPDLALFYHSLLSALRHPVFHEGTWRLLEPTQGSRNDAAFRSVVAYRWGLDNHYRLVVVNLSRDPAQCSLHLDWPSLAGRAWVLTDLLSSTRRKCEGSELLSSGLRLDMPGYGYHMFDVLPG